MLHSAHGQAKQPVPSCLFSFHAPVMLLLCSCHALQLAVGWRLWGKDSCPAPGLWIFVCTKCWLHMCQQTTQHGRARFGAGIPLFAGSSLPVPLAGTTSASWQRSVVPHHLHPCLMRLVSDYVRFSFRLLDQPSGSLTGLDKWKARDISNDGQRCVVQHYHTFAPWAL